jgi:hypothetical protein
MFRNVEIIHATKKSGLPTGAVTPGLWKDEHSDLIFTLVVDDFGVRYTTKAQVDRLLEVLQKEYKCSTNWTGSQYIGLTLEWDYEAGTCDMSMPG